MEAVAILESTRIFHVRRWKKNESNRRKSGLHDAQCPNRNCDMNGMFLSQNIHCGLLDWTACMWTHNREHSTSKLVCWSHTGGRWRAACVEWKKNQRISIQGGNARRVAFSLILCARPTGGHTAYFGWKHALIVVISSKIRPKLDKQHGDILWNVARA